MRIAFQCECDPFCRRVLARHWPDVPCFDDVRLVVGGDRLRDGGRDSANKLPPLISSQAVSPAKTSPSPAVVPDSTESGQDSSSSSPGSQGSLSDLEGGSSLRTYPDSFPPLPEIERVETLQSYSRRWPTSGFTTSPGECWTADTSECPSGGGVSTSLADVLLDEVPARFFLSPRAAAGILRRAEKRGRALPPALAGALQALASQYQGDDKRTTSTSSTPSTQAVAHPMIIQPKRATSKSRQPLLGDTQRAQTPTPPTPSSSLERSEPDARVEDALPTLTDTEPTSRTPSGPRDSTPARMARDEGRPSSLGPSDPTCAPVPMTSAASSVRRLTPTECERLQGFPDGWTIPNPTAPDTQPVATPSRSTLSTGLAVA
jgi:hypothetical protein